MIYHQDRRKYRISQKVRDIDSLRKILHKNVYSFDNKYGISFRFIYMIIELRATHDISMDLLPDT